MTAASDKSKENTPPPRQLLLIAAGFIVLLAAGWGGARWMHYAYASPTVEEYMAHIGDTAELVPAGALSYDGESFTCGRFPTVLNADLDDYAAAYLGFLIVNPDRFEKMPLTLKRYAHAHECGHQYVGADEGEADCYAIRRGRAEGWLDAGAMDDICAFISQSGGDDLHALGTRRCDMMRRCFARARPGREPL